MKSIGWLHSVLRALRSPSDWGMVRPARRRRKAWSAVSAEIHQLEDRLLLANQAPTIGSISGPTTVAMNSSFFLNANSVADPDGTVTQVAFYLDSNSDSVLDAGDLSLGNATAIGGQTWRIIVTAEDWAAGAARVFAQATDNGSPVLTGVRSFSTTVVQPNLAGVWTMNGQNVRIDQNGTSLTFINERGNRSPGQFSGDFTEVTATGWGNLTGTVAGTHIKWDNDTDWERNPPDLSGAWSFGGQNVRIEQNGSSLTFINERGVQSPGVFSDDFTRVTATGWANLTGTNEGTRIEWFNGTAWTRKPRYLSGLWTMDGENVRIEQNGSSLTFVNERGGRSAGAFNSDYTQVVATDWANLAGTVAGRDIQWDNGSQWTRILPELAGSWSFNGQNVFIEQNGASLTFINERGQRSAGVFSGDYMQVVATGWGNLVGTITGSGLLWDNGTVWTRNPPDLSGDWTFNEKSVQIEQSGLSLTFINETGQRSAGQFNVDFTQVIATGWGNLTGFIAGSRIFWDNGTEWIRA